MIFLFLLSLACVHIEKTEQDLRPTPHWKDKYKELHSYAAEKGYSTGLFLLIDFSLPSSEKRVYVVDGSGELIKSGFVAHGHCREPLNFDNEIQFSNVSGSNCSSIGRYQIAEKYSGSFGRSYRLDGLDETNSNARNRNIVLHSHSCVPDFDTELKICQSEGCPTLSPAFLDQLEPLIDQESNPVIMWMYSTSRED